MNGQMRDTADRDYTNLMRIADQVEIAKELFELGAIERERYVEILLSAVKILGDESKWNQPS